MTCDSVRRVIGRRAASPPPRPSTLYCAPFCLLRPFTLRCTGKRGVAKGEGAQQTEKGVADQSRVNGVTTCETPAPPRGRPAGRGRPNRPGAPPRMPPRHPHPGSPSRGAGAVGRVGLLGRSGAGSCPNLPQRRPGPGSTARRSPEYQRSSSRTPARPGSLQQIWTNGAATGSGEGDHDGRSDNQAGPAGTPPEPARTSPGGSATTALATLATRLAPPTRTGPPVNAPRPASTSLDPRERTSSRRARGSSDVLAG